MYTEPKVIFVMKNIKIKNDTLICIYFALCTVTIFNDVYFIYYDEHTLNISTFTKMINTNEYILIYIHTPERSGYSRFSRLNRPHYVPWVRSKDLEKLILIYRKVEITNLS